MMVKIPAGVFCILAGLAFVGVSGWVSTFSDIASMILLMALLGGGALINFGVGYAFLGDEYKATNFVRGGKTVFTAVESTKFLKRRKLVTLIGSISYVLLAIYYVVRVIVVNTFVERFQDMSTSPAALIVFAVISLIVAFALFMLYKRTKHIDLKEE